LSNSPNCEYICERKAKNVNFRASTLGDGWNFGAPHDKVSSNPALFITGFGRGERQRVEVLLKKRMKHGLFMKLMDRTFLIVK
jgi:hypothetical protein